LIAFISIISYINNAVVDAAASLARKRSANFDSVKTPPFIAINLDYFSVVML